MNKHLSAYMAQAELWKCFLKVVGGLGSIQGYLNTF